LKRITLIPTFSLREKERLVNRVAKLYKARWACPYVYQMGLQAFV